VQFLHNNNYVHQDIHFGNVFASFHRDEMSMGGNSVTFKLGDLGISKLAHEINAFNTILNPSMLAPEALQPMMFGPMNHRMDIYHCGLLFLQLFHKQPLVFTNEAILAAQPRLLAEQLPAPYNTAISKALRRHVWSRTSSARELWWDLNAQTA
jgi:serine/threonine protein kinase